MVYAIDVDTIYAMDFDAFYAIDRDVIHAMDIDAIHAMDRDTIYVINEDMMGTIIIDKLKVYAHTGVFDFEKEEGQNFYVSCKLLLRENLVSTIQDDISRTVNYAEVCDSIVTYMEDHSTDLLETITDSLAKYLLIQYSGIKEIQIRIDKPEAPIEYPFESVAYELVRGWHTAYIAYGSNMGDRENYIKEAIDSLKKDSGFRILKDSTRIVTKPYGGVEQDDFLNGCLAVETYYTPHELLNFLHLLETDAGRKRLVHWGPRTLDLDILLYDNEILHDEDLIIPHIDMQNRDFVLRPLNEIAPYAYHPVLRKTVAELYKELK